MASLRPLTARRTASSIYSCTLDSEREEEDCDCHEVKRLEKKLKKAKKACKKGEEKGEENDGRDDRRGVDRCVKI